MVVRGRRACWMGGRIEIVIVGMNRTVLLSTPNERHKDD
jgi:hypothetical protein